jgi:heme/copper-type cytochrome/quinol oxidase subunit 4
MIGADTTAPRRAWLWLLAISAISFSAAEYLGERHLAVMAILGIAAAKVLIILYRFMELDAAPRGIRIFFLSWTAICAVLPFTLWWWASG